MDQPSDIGSIFDKLSDLNDRIRRIESYLKLSEEDSIDEEIFDQPFIKKREENKTLEFEIGQFWFAKVGIIVLVFGLGIILTLPFASLPVFVPGLLGMLVSLGLLMFSKLWKESYNLISRYLFGAGFFILFISSLRFHFWGNPNFISNNIYQFAVLSAIVIILLFLSVRRRSSYLFNIGLLLGFIAALVSGSTYLIFTSIVILASLSSYIKIKYEWGRLFYWSIILIYLTHLVWFFNNPLVIGNKIGLVDEPYANIFFLMLYLVVISAGNIFRKVEFKDDRQRVISSFLNSFGFLVLFTFITIARFESEITISSIAASILFLLLSIVFWKRNQDKYSIFFFSIIGYIFLSLALINYFEIPELFIWLSWQSIIVISTAILYRSKIIILANFLIYILIAIGTIIFSTDYAWSTMNAGIVALLSARILNAKKDRLELKTDSMRVSYLILAFLILPLSTYFLVPSEYVGFTWLGLGLLYYVLSNILNNNKYRWMAISTLGITIFYTLVQVIIHPENELNVVSFIVVGIVLIIISVLYTRIKSKDNLEETNSNVT